MASTGIVRDHQHAGVARVLVKKPRKHFLNGENNYALAA